jgi:hypothetical protein
MNGYKAGIAVDGPTVPIAQMQDFDRISMVSDIRPMHCLQLGVLQAVSFTPHLLPKPTPRGIRLVIYGILH